MPSQHRLCLNAGASRAAIAQLARTAHKLRRSHSRVQITISSHSAELSWDHRKCITGYRIRLCSLTTVQCYEAQEVMSAGEEQSHVRHVISDLEPCSEYSLAIQPSTGEGELVGGSLGLVTRAPPPRPPAQVEVALNTRGDKVDISWSEVQCATGYR